MRLLHTTTLKLETRIGEIEGDFPRYAILSHTWGKDEFLFQDVPNILEQSKTPTRGLLKILNACEQARHDGWDYIWVDTCCIDKSSSAELSEAINSMFKWYAASCICYAYLEDVKLERGPNGEAIMRGFDESKWFTRGWTLQELIAPHDVHFFDCDWTRLASRYQLTDDIMAITGVGHDILVRRHVRKGTNPVPLLPSICRGCNEIDTLPYILDRIPIAGKMRWASDRRTTRVEDTAYCLMGLFNINMPLLYGEGKNALIRLQDALLNDLPDQSILAWIDELPPDWSANKSYMCSSIRGFTLDLFRPQDLDRTDIFTTGKGIEAEVLLGSCCLIDVTRRRSFQQDLDLAVLSCALEGDQLSRVAILVTPVDPGSPSKGYRRVRPSEVVILRPDVPPELILTDHDILGGRESDDKSTVRVRNDFKPATIFFPAKYVHLGQYLTPRVKLAIHGCGDDWKSKVKSQELLDSDMNLTGAYYRDDSIRVGGVLLLRNRLQRFYVAWLYAPLEPSASTPESTAPTAWKYGSCVMPSAYNRPEPSLRSRRQYGDMGGPATRESLEQVLHYAEENIPTGLDVFEMEHRGSDFSVKVQIELKEFLGRTQERLRVDIDGWDEDPLSGVDYITGSPRHFRH